MAHLHKNTDSLSRESNYYPEYNALQEKQSGWVQTILSYCPNIDQGNRDEAQIFISEEMPKGNRETDR